MSLLWRHRAVKGAPLEAEPNAPNSPDPTKEAGSETPKVEPKQKKTNK